MYYLPFENSGNVISKILNGADITGYSEGDDDVKIIKENNLTEPDVFNITGFNEFSSSKSCYILGAEKFNNLTGLRSLKDPRCYAGFHGYNSSRESEYRFVGMEDGNVFTNLTGAEAPLDGSDFFVKIGKIDSLTCYQSVQNTIIKMNNNVTTVINYTCKFTIDGKVFFYIKRVLVIS